MKHDVVRRTLALSTALGLSVAVPAFAETTPSQSSQAAPSMGEIVVTARRVEERLEDVPISITVYNQQQLANRNIFNAADLGLYTPSLATNEGFGPEKSSFAIRGFTQAGKTSPSVAVYFADVVDPRSNGGTTSGNGVGVGQLFDLQNVEVLKGPQGTLFGRNTTGGAVLLVPQKPTDKLGGYVEGSAGDYNMHRIQAVLNVPVNDHLRIRGGIDWNQRDGYLTNHSGVGPTHMENTNYVSARLSVVADLNDKLENYTIGSYSKSNTFGGIPKLLVCDQSAHPISALAPLACAQIARQNARGDGLRDVENDDPNPFERIQQWQLINTTTWQATEDLTVKNIFSYAQYREAADFDLFGDNFIIPGTQILATKTIQLEPGFSGYNSLQSTLTEELQIQGKMLEGKLRWQAGGYLESSKPLGFNSGLTDIFINCTNIATYQCTGAGVISDSQVKDTFNNKGLYAQATYDLSEQFSVTTGIRYTMDRMTDVSQDANIAVPAPGTGIFICQNRVLFNGGSLTIPLIVQNTSQCQETFKISSNRPTWLIDFDYKPMADLLTYAKWARGYRQGGINPNNVGLETWGPEKVDTFEIGAKATFHGAVPGYFNTAAFYNNFRNQELAVNTLVAPAFANAVSPAQPIVNAGKSRIWGFEVDTSVSPFKGFTADGAYTYLNTKLLTFTPPPTPIYYSALLPTADVGQALSLSPKNRFTLTGTYTFPVSDSVGTPWISVIFTHTDANRAVSPLASPSLYLLPAQNLLNLNAGLNGMFGQPIDLSFFMTNVTNKGFLVSPSASLFTIGADGGVVNEPRMFGFRLRYKFGS